MIKKYCSIKTIFFDKLNDLKKIEPNQNLKRIIIRQKNKKKYILLKKAINKWRNEAADYEICKLKDKLLVKIYDKNKKILLKKNLKIILFS